MSPKQSGELNITKNMTAITCIPNILDKSAQTPSHQILLDGCSGRVPCIFKLVQA